MAKSLFTSSIAGGINITPVVSPTANVGITGTADIFENADTQVICSPNSVCKYFNIRLKAAIKSSEAEFRPGFVEYGLIQYENQGGVPLTPSAITSGIGTQTLEEMLRNQFRNHCGWTGAVPISVEMPIVLDMHIKIPSKWCKNQKGSYWMFYYAFRSSKSTDTVTTLQFVYSHEYKVYI